MKIVIIAALAAIFIALGAYWAGGRAGASKCRAEIAELSNAAVIAAQDEITEIKRNANADAFNTGVRDIRDRLRKRYTIKD